MNCTHHHTKQYLYLEVKYITRQAKSCCPIPDHPLTIRSYKISFLLSSCLKISAIIMTTLNLWNSSIGCWVSFQFNFGITSLHLELFTILCWSCNRYGPSPQMCSIIYTPYDTFPLRSIREVNNTNAPGVEMKWSQPFFRQIKAVPH